MAEAYIIDAVRTPRGIGKVGKGSLAHLHQQHLRCLQLLLHLRRLQLLIQLGQSLEPVREN